uniref:Transposase (Putative), gypsy type n=1 Tax=Tanacetum cinerariifolium TaxID=118510 RepID=A0A6L2KV30_TANCI|nr:hypothetical protein [Tanacetum cinerariifolium]
MAKKDMDLYHSRLTPNDLNDLIIKYKIPRDLHPRLPSEDFVMSELPDDIIALEEWVFFIDWRAILNVMVWRHPDVASDDPRPAAGSFNMADVRCLSVHVIKLKDMPEGVLVLSGLSRVLEESFMGIHDFLCLSEWTDDEVQEEPRLDLLRSERPLLLMPLRAMLLSALGLPWLNHSVVLCPSLFLGNDDESDDDDACVEISLVTPLSVGASLLLLLKALTPKGVMVDDAVALSVGVSRPRLSFKPAPSFRDVFGEAIHMDFFPSSTGPYYATYPEDGVARNFESMFDDLTAKMIVLHCMMMSHGGELLALYRWLNQSYHEYVLSTDSRLKGYEEKSKAKGKERKKKIKSLTKSLDNLHIEVAHLSAALNQAAILKAEKDEEIIRLKTTPLEFSSFFWGQSTDRLAEASPLVAQTNYAFLNKISEHAAEPVSVILQLEPKKLVCPASIPTPRDAHVSPFVTMELTVTHASKSLEISTNVDLTASVVASEHNEEMVSAEVDGSDPKMTDDTITAMFGHAFVKGIFVVLNDVVELSGVGSRRVSSGPNDVVVPLSAGEKGDGLTPSCVAGEEAVVNPFRV